MLRRTAMILLPCAAALALVGCGSGDDAEPAYEAGVEDASGGELIVTDADQPGVEVELPETPMTPVPAESAGPTATVTTPPRTLDTPATGTPAE